MEIKNKLSASLEDYLEAIFHIVEEKHASKAKDIAKRLNVNNSSVTGALRSLAEKGLINYAPYDLITLTKEGQKIAEGIVERHKLLMRLFVNVLSINEDEAEEAACKMEHSISMPILEKLSSLVNFLETGHVDGKDMISIFNEFYEKNIELKRE